MSAPIIITPENITVQSTGSNAGTSSGNVTLISDGVNSDLTIVCNYDYSDSSPGTDEDHKTGFYYADFSGTSSDPYIDYTLSTGYGNDVSGVASGNISSVNGIATADISKIIGT